ncbi:MAG: GNAT family acetyltransferase [Verrucomicrobiota bacterium]
MSESSVEIAPGEIIRFYRPNDRDAVRTICCETGFLGKAIDPVFEDRELFADFLTAYYTDEEPESSIVLEVDGELKGYVLGSRFPDRQSAFNKKTLFGRLKKIAGRFFGTYNQATQAYIFWLFFKGWREVPHTPKGMAHFHINLLPEFKNVQRTRALIDFFLNYLSREGESSVYGQMVTFSNRRGERMFARYGFEVIDSKEVTKFRKYTDKKVFLFTIVKDLTKNVGLYGTDLWKERAEQEKPS